MHRLILPCHSFSEEAVEFEELDQFLRLKEEWEPLEDDKPLLRAIPVGVPGAYSPAQMNPEHVSPAPSPIKTKPSPIQREGEIDAGDQLEDASLRGVNVTEDDLMKLVEELGLDGADADDLVKGLKGEDTQLSPAAKEDIEVPVEVVSKIETNVEPPKDEVVQEMSEKVQGTKPKDDTGTQEKVATKVGPAVEETSAGESETQEKTPE